MSVCGYFGVLALQSRAIPVVGGASCDFYFSLKLFCRDTVAIAPRRRCEADTGPFHATVTPSRLRIKTTTTDMYISAFPELEVLTDHRTVVVLPGTDLHMFPMRHLRGGPETARQIEALLRMPAT